VNRRGFSGSGGGLGVKQFREANLLRNEVVIFGGRFVVSFREGILAEFEAQSHSF
jgi:hypothetical protein